MKQYLDLLRRVRDTGTVHPNRTGTPTRRITGAMLEFDMNDGFPAVTTKQLFFGAVKGELLGFLRGASSASEFRDLGCKIWDQNANENKDWLANPNRHGHDDLGRIYGVQWRNWRGPFGLTEDPLADITDLILARSSSRRLIVNAWNPGELDQMALPPCHVLHQYHVDADAGTLSVTMYMRSCDMFLGVPFNIASYALLLHLVAKATGLRPSKLVMFLADVHIYENHLDQVDEQLARLPLPLPRLHLSERLPVQALTPIEYLESLVPADIALDDYQHYAPIAAPMAV